MIPLLLPPPQLRAACNSDTKDRDVVMCDEA